MGLPAGGGALVGRANAEEVIWIGVEPPGPVALLIDRLSVWDRLSGHDTSQRFLDLIKGPGICQKPFQGLLGPAKESTDRCLGFECRAHLGNKFFHRIGYLIHGSRSLASYHWSVEQTDFKKVSPAKTPSTPSSESSFCFAHMRERFRLLVVASPR
jgi:hypothetical protein